MCLPTDASPSCEATRFYSLQKLSSVPMTYSSLRPKVRIVTAALVGTTTAPLPVPPFTGIRTAFLSSLSSRFLSGITHCCSNQKYSRPFFPLTTSSSESWLLSQFLPVCLQRSVFLLSWLSAGQVLPVNEHKISRVVAHPRSTDREEPSTLIALASSLTNILQP